MRNVSTKMNKSKWKMAQSYEAEAQVIGVKISRGQAKTREFEEITAFLLQGQNPARCLLL